MAKEVFCPWEERYELGVKIIDEQHKELVHLTNELYNACRQGEDFARDAFQEAIKVTVKYVGVHFSTEEKIMERINYRDMVAHKAQHQEFVRKVLGEVKNFEEGKDFVPNAFVRFLRDWILSHVSLTDKAFVDCIKVSMGQKAS